MAAHATADPRKGPGPNLTVKTRFSSLSFPSNRLSLGGESLPCSPLLPNTPDATTTRAFPRSMSGQSIPIFFSADDVIGGTTGGGDSSPESEQKDPFDGALLEEPEDMRRFSTELNRLSSHTSSSASSRCFSIDSSSGASISTAPTEPPSPLTPTSVTAKLAPSPLSSPSPLPFPLPLPLPVDHTDPPAPHPLLNARRNVSSRPGTAPTPTTTSPPRPQISHSPSLAYRTPRSYHSHHCLKQRRATPTSSPPADAFFDPSSSSRPSTASTFGSAKAIPIRLVPATPTDAERAARIRARRLRPAPSSPALRTGTASSSFADSSKPLPALPVFPTVFTPSNGEEAQVQPQPRRRTPPSTPSSSAQQERHRSRSEGVYNVPVYPPCVYPPSPLRSPPRTALNKFPTLTSSPRNDGYSPIVGSASASTSDLPTHVAAPSLSESTRSSIEGARFVVGESTLQLLIDQEGFRDAKVEFVYTGEDTETGLLEFVARKPATGREREGWPFNVGFLQSPPHLRRLHLNHNPSVDYLPREASLAIGTKNGVYKVSSHSSLDLEQLESAGQEIVGSYFCFAYEVRERLNLVGRPMKGERLLKPLVFVCSREFLHPGQGRKVGFLHFLARTFALPSSSALVLRQRQRANSETNEDAPRRDMQLA
ncbi:hypothetical protein JCM1840_005094 [Sporobolomyces johnsonii]